MMLGHCRVALLVLAIAGCGGGGGGSGSAGGGSPAAGGAAPSSAVQASGVVEAAALSNHFVELTFADPQGSDAGDPANYYINDASGTELRIEAAELSADATRVILTTDSQEDVTYTLTEFVTQTVAAPRWHFDFSPIRSANAQLVDNTKRSAITFRGSVKLEPYLLYAVSLSNTEILVTMSTKINKRDTNGVLEPRFFRLDKGMVVTEAVLVDLNDLDGTVVPTNSDTIKLTTLPQEAVEYTLQVTNVYRQSSRSYRTGFVNPFLNTATLIGTPATAQFDDNGDLTAGIPDVDQDGVADHEERRGYTVYVRLGSGEMVERHVSSDTRLKDTDGDQISDADEVQYGTDPRSPDTDGDTLTDNQELNHIYSNPADQDTDKDGLTDGLEFNFFRSSPLLADTDGDQIPDGDEVILANRDPRLADLPRPSIEVGDVDLRLSYHFVHTSETSTTNTESETVSSTLTKSDDKSYSRTNERNQAYQAEASYKFTWSSGGGVGGGTVDLPFPKYQHEVGGGFSTTQEVNSSFTEASSRQTQREYAQSLTDTSEITEGETSTREIDGASISTTVTLSALGDIAFSITNLEIIALMPDKRDPGRLRPIATLVPASQILEGADGPPSFNLGPLAGEKGPIQFVNTEIFPSLVEELMASPTGLIFKIANYDIVDERGRNFAYSSQEINDRTAPLVFDFGGADIDGDGVGDTSELHRVATGIGRLPAAICASADDFNEDGDVDAQDQADIGAFFGFDCNDPGTETRLFDPAGRAIGVDFHDMMQTVLDLKHYRYELADVRNYAAIAADEALTASQQHGSYATVVDADGHEIVHRIRQVRNINDLAAPDKRRRWAVITSDGLLPVGNVTPTDQVLLPNRGLSFAYVQDLDEDGVPGRLEYANGCSDRDQDTDDDSLDDHLEVFGARRDTQGRVEEPEKQWMVNVVGLGSYEAFSRCNSVDADLDGLLDIEEYDARVYERAEDGTLKRDADNQLIVAFAFPLDARTDPRAWDTDGDGISDYDEIHGYTVYLSLDIVPGESGCTDIADDLDHPGRDAVSCKTDPLNPDHDSDTLPDGAELQLGLDPTRNDGSDAADFEPDGLVGYEERFGWPVTSRAVSTVVGVPGASFTCELAGDAASAECSQHNESRPPTSSNIIVDTDGDGLTDFEEKYAATKFGSSSGATHPNDRDTDNDGREDFTEVFGYEATDASQGGGEPLFLTDPTKADTDDDTLNDAAELTPYIPGPYLDADGISQSIAAVVTDPTVADIDGDDLGDREERDRKTDATNNDTDGDSVKDGNELVLGTDPLNAAQACARVSFTSFKVIKDCDVDPAGGPGEFLGRLRARRIKENGDVAELSDMTADIQGSYETNQIRNLSNSQDVILARGDRIQFYADGLVECDDNFYPSSCAAPEWFTDGSDPFSAIVTFTNVKDEAGEKAGTDDAKGNVYPNDCHVQVAYKVRFLADLDVNSGETFCR